MRKLINPAQWLRPGYKSAPCMVTDDCEIGDGVMLSPYVNLYGCKIGANTKIGAYVEIAEGVTIGEDCKVCPGALMGPGLTIGKRCYIGPNVIFANVRYPKAFGDVKVEETQVGDDVSIGSGSLIMPGVVIGDGAEIAAGMVVTKSVWPQERIRLKLTTLTELPVQAFKK